MHSLLDYSDVIYDTCSNIDSTKIEKNQPRALILLKVRVRRYKTSLKEASVEPLKTRRKLHRLTYLFKIKNKLKPDYLVNIHPLSSHNTQHYDLRRPSQLIHIRELPHIAIFFPSHYK